MKWLSYQAKFIYSICLLYSGCIFAFSTTNSVEFYYSNNNHVIDIQKAYERLVSYEQKYLTKKAIHILQKQHMEQGRFKNMLGTYTSQSDNNTTADNTEVFYTSPLQNLSQLKVFKVAAIFANQLNQESVAVFIPSKSNNIAHIKLIFLSDKPTINDTIKLLQEKLPDSYRQAYSLSLGNAKSGFNLAKVQAIEWLGSNLNEALIKSTFPKDKVHSFYGNSYLVFKDGKSQKL